MHPNTPYTWLKRFCERTDQPFYGVHHFRHLNATLQIVSGADARTSLSKSRALQDQHDVEPLCAHV